MNNSTAQQHNNLSSRMTETDCLKKLIPKPIIIKLPQLDAQLARATRSTALFVWRNFFTRFVSTCRVSEVTGSVVSGAAWSQLGHRLRVNNVWSTWSASLISFISHHLRFVLTPRYHYINYYCYEYS